MCGIAGIISGSIPDKYQLVSKMITTLGHRGPDDWGIYDDNSDCCIGHARLSIVDPAGGHQPMSISDNDLIISFNGEIYGYNDIKKTNDYPFKSESDTEVILYLYKKYSIGFINDLPGMFAFAIWDNNKKELVCGRDRFGEKPLFYSLLENGTFIFASEIKAIISTGLVKTTINEQALVHFLQKLYINPYQTIYNEIKTLPPAHYLIFKNGSAELFCYWNLPPVNNSLSVTDATTMIKQLLEKSVAHQMVADVPVGTFLSGGIDSTVVTALASKINPDIKSFSFSFEGDQSEIYYSRVASQYLKINNIELKDINYNIKDILFIINDLMDEPLADSSIIPSYLISKYASQYMKVILTGDGGDELFGGYKWYNNLLAVEPTLKNDNHSIFFQSMVYNLAAKLSNRKIHRLKLLIDDRHARDSGASLLRYHYRQYLFFSDAEIESFGLHTESYNYHLHTFTDSIDDAIRYDIVNYMPGNILTKIDRSSMANSLELRAPFLDKNLAEFCISLPWNLKVSQDDNKIILKETFRDIIPDDILSRKKQGFGAPVNKWLSSPEFTDIKNEYLYKKTLPVYNFLKYDQCSRYFYNNSYQTWILLVLSLWFTKATNMQK